MASYLWDASTFTKYGFKIMMNMLDTKMFIKTSINDCLWNLTDPLVQKAKTMMPGLVPEENMGILYQVNRPIHVWPDTWRIMSPIQSRPGPLSRHEWYIRMCLTRYASLSFTWRTDCLWKSVQKVCSPRRSYEYEGTYDDFTPVRA